MTIQSKYLDSSIDTLKQLSIISYNITASFFDRNDKTDDQRHCWVNRVSYVIRVLEKYEARVWCLQELSVRQAIELYNYFKENYDCFFLNQTPSDIETTGEIVRNGQIVNWENVANIGTPLIGIFVKKTSGLRIEETGRFWLNENPDAIPTNRDRAETDKGFGNRNTYRAVLWAKIFDEITNNYVYVFNSHYPLSGDNGARYLCAQLEMEKIRKITDGARWVSCGDRNIIPIDSNNLTKNDVYQMLTSFGNDVVNPENHHGTSNTWMGFTYDPQTRPINADEEVLDVVVSNMRSNLSIHDPVAFKDGELIDIECLNDPEIVNYINESRYLASDHCLVYAVLSME